MDEPMNRFEQRLESALRDYVERPESSWEPAAVVADVTSRREWQVHPGRAGSCRHALRRLPSSSWL